jgi:histone-lysine N-methyltransferase SETD2
VPRFTLDECSNSNDYFNEDSSSSKPESSTEPPGTTTTTGHGISSDSNATEAFKIIKDQFRDMLSKLIIKLLQPYMRRECTVGRLSNVDDFKFLARKFTHTILDKEMSRSTRLDALPNSADKRRIHAKADEFIRKYLGKFGAEYSRKLDELNSNNNSTS